MGLLTRYEKYVSKARHTLPPRRGQLVMIKLKIYLAGNHKVNMRREDQTHASKMQIVRVGMRARNYLLIKAGPFLITR